MTELKDVINFYIGCEMLAENGDKYRLDTVGVNSYSATLISKTYRGSSSGKLSALNEKPILRKLSDMTEEEALMVVQFAEPSVKAIKLFPIEAGERFFTWSENLEEPYIAEQWRVQESTPEQFVYLIKQGFDLFGLIESKQAITKTIST